jgi:predicted nuclease of predicted toxin-antitoxin system
VKKRKLLLDSCVAKAVADRLRADGHDAAAVATLGLDPGDAAILDLAVQSGRVLVTLDSDFGMLVFRDGAKHAGVLRLRPMRADALAQRASELIDAHGDDLEGAAFVTDDGDAVRVTKH